MGKNLWIMFGITVIVIVSILLVALLILVPQGKTAADANVGEYEKIVTSDYTYTQSKDINDDTVKDTYSITTNDIKDGKNIKQYKPGKTDPFAEVVTNTNNGSNTNNTNNQNGTNDNICQNGNNEKYVEIFDKISTQYTNEQLRIIIGFLPVIRSVTVTKGPINKGTTELKMAESIALWLIPASRIKESKTEEYSSEVLLGSEYILHSFTSSSW